MGLRNRPHGRHELNDPFVATFRLPQRTHTLLTTVCGRTIKLDPTLTAQWPASRFDRGEGEVPKW